MWNELERSPSITAILCLFFLYAVVTLWVQAAKRINRPLTPAGEVTRRKLWGGIFIPVHHGKKLRKR